MLGQTPMMRQYEDIKAQYPDVLLFFRLGDFYEMFGEDARLASRELGITLTARDAGMAAKIPMCGVPHHAVDQYLTKLVQKGYRVAICEQMEDPKSVKGIVKRDIVRIVSSGTMMDMDAGAQSSYLAALFQEGEGFGLAVCDAATGECYVAQYQGKEGQDRLRDELFRLKPPEMLIPLREQAESGEQAFCLSLDIRETLCLTKLPLSAFDRNAGQAKLKALMDFPAQGAGHTQVEPSDPIRTFWALAGRSAAALLGYLEDTQKMEPKQILSIKPLRPEDGLIMDATTFRNLEIVRNIRAHDKNGSLYDLLDETRTASGSRRLRQWLEKPLTDLEQIEARLDAVETIMNLWGQRQALRKQLDQVHDLDRLMTRITYGRATPRELTALRQSLSVLPEVRQVTEALSQTGAFAHIRDALDPLEDIHALLHSALTDPAPASLKDGHVIRPGYNEQVDAYRESAKNGRDWMAALEAEEREKTGIKSLKIGFNKVFGYYFEVTKTHLAEVPAYFQRKQTLAGGERYGSEALTRLENLVLGAEDKLQGLEETLYQNLLLELGQALPRVQRTSRALAALDVFQALGEAAVKRRYCRPVMLERQTHRLRFKDLRHPVVEMILEHPGFIPNDLVMDADSSLFIITGPNMGGKSTYCRSVAVAVIMAQIGSFVPASEAEIAIRDRVFARVGASDDLKGGQSTFMVEMNEVAHILRYATPSSLVVLDEVGRGTGTFDGMSVAWAVSEYLVHALGAKALFATHYLELTQLAQRMPQVRNLSLAVREEGDQIVFLHKILPGAADKSYGVHVARLAGLPQEVVDKANLMLKELERSGKSKPTPTLLPETDQLSLFADLIPKPAKIPKSKADPVIHALMSANLLTMTPLDALNFLFELQQKVKGS